MSATPPESMPMLFGELVELPAAARLERLAVLDGAAPDLASELRVLLEAGDAAGDFLRVLEATQPAATATRQPRAVPIRAMPTPGIEPGMSVGPYRINRLLGRGGMAVVWLARDERLDRPVALKVITGARDSNEPAERDGRSPLMIEARTAAQLDHPHIAGVYDVGQTSSGDAYIAMAYCEGGSLADRLAAGPLALDDALRAARQLASALGAAHAHGIIHRDVKPANVLFDARGDVRLADFGIARPTSQEATRGAMLGTMAYLAPEQLRAEAVDHRADLWAFGVTLYEMVTGCRPFAGQSEAAVLYGIIAAQPEPIARKAASVAAPETLIALDALTFRLLDKDPTARPESAAEVDRWLASVQAASSGGADEGTPQADDAKGRSALARPAGPSPPLTPLIGRERELALATTLLARVRLLTLRGPGGTGKTRLATELAVRTRPGYADGVYVVSLASTTAPDLVATTIAQAVGLRGVGNADPGRQVMQYFADAQALLVLDNFEHLLPAAPLVTGLLTATTRLSVLVTSRAPLRVQGEQELPLPPLELPESGAGTAVEVGAAAAVRLFVRRAQAARPDFALTDANAAAVAAICQRLDGLPLAIELAAPRIKVLAPRALLGRLDHRLELLHSDRRDTPPRHRTLRGVIDWSYDLLTPRAQSLLRGCAVFADGFALDAAAAIAGPSPPVRSGTVDVEGRGADEGGTIPPADAVKALDDVASLCDWSLLVRREQHDGEPRFHLLETIREYCLARSRETGEEERARAAHCAHFLALAEHAAPHLRGPSQVEWLERLEVEQDNLRAALDHAMNVDDVVSATRLGVALQWFWLGSRSVPSDAIAHLRALHDRISAETEAGSRVSAGMHARLLAALGLLTGVRGDSLDVPRGYHEASLAAYERAGDDEGLATALNHVGWLSFMMGDLEAATAFSNDALMRHRAANKMLGVATASVNLGWVSLSRGALLEAERLFGEALAIHRVRNDRRACAYALGHVATTAVRRGEHARAIALYDELIALAEPLGDRILEPTFRARLEATRYEMGEPAVAVLEAMEGQLLPRLREAGHAWSLGYVLSWIGRIHSDTGALDRARCALDESLAVRRGAADRSGVAESEGLLAELARRAGDLPSAAALWRSSLLERRAMGEAVAVAESMEAVAALALDRGDAALATRLLAGAAVERERLGAPAPPRHRPGLTKRYEELDRRLGHDDFRAAWAEGSAASPETLCAAAAALDARS